MHKKKEIKSIGRENERTHGIWFENYSTFSRHAVVVEKNTLDEEEEEERKIIITLFLPHSL